MNDDMRKLMTLINEAVDIDVNSSPDTYEDRDAEHYDALAKTGFFGSQGAGAILIAKTTGRIMLCLRSAQVLEPFTWGNCGGAHGKDERPIEAAKREVYEETGYTGSISMVPLMVFSKEGFRYCNFLAIVEEEFEPNLGWEADRAVWVQVGKLPRPLHFGMESLFADQESVKVIRHYAAMFSQGQDVSESLSENLDLPAGVDTGKAIAKAQEVAQELADEEEEEVAAALGTAPVKAPVQGQQPKGGAPAVPPKAGMPAPMAPAGKKSLAAIKPQ